MFSGQWREAMNKRNLGQRAFTRIVRRLGHKATNEPRKARILRRKVHRMKHSPSSTPLSRRLKELIEEAKRTGLSMRHSDSVRYHFFHIIGLMAGRKSVSRQKTAIREAWLLYEDAGLPGQVF